MTEVGRSLVVASGTEPFMEALTSRRGCGIINTQR